MFLGCGADLSSWNNCSTTYGRLFGNIGAWRGSPDRPRVIVTHCQHIVNTLTQHVQHCQHVDNSLLTHGQRTTNINTQGYFAMSIFDSIDDKYRVGIEMELEAPSTHFHARAVCCPAIPSMQGHFRFPRAHTRWDSGRGFVRHAVATPGGEGLRLREGVHLLLG